MRVLVCRFSQPSSGSCHSTRDFHGRARQDTTSCTEYTSPSECSGDLLLARDVLTKIEPLISCLFFVCVYGVDLRSPALTKLILGVAVVCDARHPGSS